MLFKLNIYIYPGLSTLGLSTLGRRYISDSSVNNKYNNICENSPFNYPIVGKLSKDYSRKIFVNLNLDDLVCLDAFTSKVNNLHGVNIIIIKIAFTNNDFKMAGSQIVIDFNLDNSYEDLRSILIDRISILLDRYGSNASSINHIILMSVPFNLDYVNKFKNKVGIDSHMDRFIRDNFTTKSILPISINFLGSELHKVVRDGKIVDVTFTNSYIYPPKLISFKDAFVFNRTLNCIDVNFKFYLTMLNSKPYVLGINHINHSCIRKIRLNLSGTLIEDVTDYVLSDNSIKRVSGGNVMSAYDNLFRYSANGYKKELKNIYIKCYILTLLVEKSTRQLRLDILISKTDLSVC